MRWFSRALAVGGIGWFAAVLLAPFAIHSSSSILSHAAALVYAAGGLVCHQRPERSFWAADSQLPVCARCTGLYFAAALAAPCALAFGSSVSGRSARLAALVAAVPTAATWSLEFAGLAHPSNTVRAVAALPLGFVAAWLVVSVALFDRGAAWASNGITPR